MNTYDSLGARQEPPEQTEPIGLDMFGNDLYGDETILINDYDVILADDTDKYLDHRLEKMKLSQKLRRIEELSSYLVDKDVEDLKLIDDLLSDILTDKIKGVGTAEYFNLSEEKASEAL